MPLEGAVTSQIRDNLLRKSLNSSVTRELWSCGTGPVGTYAAYRSCIQQRRRAAASQGQGLGRGRGPAATLPGGGPGDAARGHDGARSRPAGTPQSLPATVKYSFEGVKHVVAEASSPVTALAFAALRSDLLAFGCADGELWLVRLPTSEHSTDAAGASPQAQSKQPACTKARKMHGGAVQAVDWAFDNSQLLSVGRDGSLCVWDAAHPAAGLTCIRSMCAPTIAYLCGRFHRVNFSLALLGTSAAALELVNCNTGMLHSRYHVAPVASGVHVTALDSSNHHVFLGDSAGQLHWYSCEMRHRQLTGLRLAGRMRLAVPAGAATAGGSGGGSWGGQPAAVTTVQYVPFCRSTDTPVLMVALQDGSLCIVRANEARHTADLYLRRVVPMPGGGGGGPAGVGVRSGGPFPGGGGALGVTGGGGGSVLLRFCPSVCPLSVIQDVPLITYGSPDTAVYIVDVTARGFGAPGGGTGGGGGGGSGGTQCLERPMTVTVLKAHRAAVTVVAWSYDEALLASADAEGLVVLWRRCRLF